MDISYRYSYSITRVILYLFERAILDLIPPSQEAIAIAMNCIIAMVLITHRQYLSSAKDVPGLLRDRCY